MFYFIGNTHHGAPLFLTTCHPASKDGVPVVVLDMPALHLRMAYGPCDIVDILPAGEYVGMWLREKERTEEERRAGEAFLSSSQPDPNSTWEMKD
jgi:hypothetical protein